MTDIAEQIGIGGRVCTKFSDDGQFVSKKGIERMTVLDSLIGWFYILIRDDKKIKNPVPAIRYGKRQGVGEWYF